jgi:hypothetical protein
MYSINQARRIRGAAGDPLPTVFKSFQKNHITFRRGQLCLICAGPGTGKSALALTLPIRSGVPTLYLSADSDPFTQVSRSLSAFSGLPMDESERYARGEKVDEETTVKALEMALLPIRFNFLPSPTLPQIERSMNAFDELYGEYPFGGLEVFLEFAHEMARTTQSCVIGLHHVNGPYNDADKPIPMSGIKGQIGRVPEMVLTLFRSGPDSIGVSPVKNRGSKADASGQTYADLYFDGSTMTIADMEDTVAPFAGGVVGSTDPLARRVAEEMMG